MTPNEKEIWVTDGHNESLHVFDTIKMRPVKVRSIKLREQSGWITFSVDGKNCWPSTSNLIDVKTRKIVTTLTDEKGRRVMS